MKTYNQLLHSYSKELNEKDIPIQTLRAFLFELCNEMDIDLYMEMDNEVNPELYKRFEEGMHRILAFEPMNYVLGYSYFFGYKLDVNPNVLIPRPETEELIGLILSTYDEYYKDRPVIDVADVATGSGAIAIALKKEEDHFNMNASDISEDALNVARNNALKNCANINFMQGDMCKPLIENNIKLDILVSNPPYIKEDEVLEKSVIDFEPNIALFGGKSGLKFYDSILNDSRQIMKDNSFIFFEMGYDQKENLTNLVKSYYPNASVEVFKDINQKNRMMRIHLTK